MKRPVAGIVGGDIKGPDSADWYVNRGFRPLRRFGHPATVRACHREMMSVQMDRVVRHGEVGHAHAYAVAQSHRQRIDSRKDPAVPGPHIEVRHF